ncbi:MAG: hypothetical protein IT523_04665 [Burkholderiales bacterium]|nr:hypothetical protein [Pseudomonadota bacterium]MCC7067725.1 hypothetical protein [Burkholderiales bacterium]
MKWDVATLGTVFWPAFLGAALLDGLVFTLVDPATIEVFGYQNVSRQAAYTVGFFTFWIVIMAASAATLWLHRIQTASTTGSSSR